MQLVHNVTLWTFFPSLILVVDFISHYFVQKNKKQKIH